MLSVAALASMVVGSAARAQKPPPAPDAPDAPAPTGDDELPPEYRPLSAEPGPPSSQRLRTRAAEEDDEDAATTVRRAAREETQWGFGVRTRLINTPQWMLNAFVDHSTPMTSFSIAAELVRRKGNFDIVLSFEYANISPDDGLWLEKGDDPGMLNGYPDFVDFDGLGLASGDVSFLWHVPIVERVALRVGGGFGIGFPTGSFTHQDTTCRSGTDVDDLDDPNHCTLVPGRIEEGDVPPVVPIINVLVGVRFRISDQVSLQLEGGWRFPSFFMGGGLGYFF